MAELLHQVKTGVDNKFENKSSLDEEVARIFPFLNRERRKTNFPNPKMYGSNCEAPFLLLG